MYEELEKYLINEKDIKLSDFQEDNLHYLLEKFLIYFNGKSDPNVDGGKLKSFKEDFLKYSNKSKIQEEPKPFPKTYKTILN